MRILVTGARGFVGRNLCENLKNVRDRKDRTRGISVEEVMEYDKTSEKEALLSYCQRADVIFHLAGVNRPERQEEFQEGNVDFSETLLKILREVKNPCPIMVSSSIQAGLTGRFAGSPYGQSKLAEEALFAAYQRETGARVCIYRFPGLFGKWCRPNYNSVVATFCHKIARGLPIEIHDRESLLELVYMDDLLDEMFALLRGEGHRADGFKTGGEMGDFLPEASFTEGEMEREMDRQLYYRVPVSHEVSLGDLADLLEGFRGLSESLLLPEIPTGSFAKKLYATYLSYLPREAVSYPLQMNIDHRGIFTELLKTAGSGQVSINVAYPGMARGDHWHNSKSEIFMVVAGHGLIRERKIGSEEIMEFEVWGDRMQAIQMLPGYTHSIINLSETDNLVTVMWANEPFDKEHPDTFSEEVDQKKAIGGHHD